MAKSKRPNGSPHRQRPHNHGDRRHQRSSPASSQFNTSRSSKDSRESGFVFRGAAAPSDNYYRPSYHESRDYDARRDFSYRSGNAPSFPPSVARSNRSPPRQPRNFVHRPRQMHNGRRGFVPKPAHQRDILVQDQKRETTPERLAGKYLDTEMRFENIDEAFAADAMPAAKRIKMQHGRVAPKWSNPDPYTVLPAPGTPDGPKKDIVQAIRMAKRANEQVATDSAARDNVDFISFDDDGGFDDDESSESGSRDRALAPASKRIRLSPQRQHSHHFDGSHDISQQRAYGLGQRRSFSSNPALWSDDNSKSKHEPIHGSNSTSFDNNDEKEDGEILPHIRRVSFSQPGSQDDATSLELIQQQRRRSDSLQAEQLAALRKAISQPPKEPRGKTHPRKSTYRPRPNTNTDFEIDEAWQPTGEEDTSPWYDEELDDVPNAVDRLHSEIDEYYDYVRPRAADEAIRQDLIRRITDVLSHHPQLRVEAIQVHAFGSFAGGIYLPDADMDLVVLSKSYITTGTPVICQDSGKIRKLTAHIVRSNIAASRSVLPIIFARVPLVKYVDARSGLRVDVSFENASGLRAIKYYNAWKEQFPCLPVLASLIKQLLALHGHNEVHTGGIGGFTIICLCVSWLQNQSGSYLDVHGDNPKQFYADILLGFLGFYGTKFDYQSEAILMEPPAYRNKSEDGLPPCKTDRLTVIDPNDSSNDLAGASHKTPEIFELFSQAYYKLCERLDAVKKGEDTSGSILSCVWGASYKSFDRSKELADYAHESIVAKGWNHDLLPMPNLSKMTAPPVKIQRHRGNGPRGKRKWDDR